MVCTKLYQLQFLVILGLLVTNLAFGQTDLQAWGNITGLRIDNKLITFESSLRVVYDHEWKWEKATAQERNWTTYSRNGNIQVVRTHMDSLFFTKSVKDLGKGKVEVEITTDSQKKGELLKAAFLHLNFPATEFKSSEITPISPMTLPVNNITGLPVGQNEIMRVLARGVEVNATNKNLKITTEQPLVIVVKTDPKNNDLRVYFTLLEANSTSKQTTKNFTIEGSASGDIKSAEVKIFPQYPGNKFLGLGGNFRLQNPTDDPPVIDFLLKNLDVRMGRVEMPWQLWHPEENVDPLEAARKGDIHPHVKASMEMARRLHEMGMPVLLAGWFPPQWAAIGEVTRNPRKPDGSFGNQLDQRKAEKIYESITSYMVYLKEAYGVDVEMFSFNESDLGINVRQTPEEHARLIKELGAYMASKGLITKLLLGDTADANGFAFMDIALNDPETWEYIGAVSFHSWRGWDKETLLEWYHAADRLNVPLIIGEGSIDAAAWRYPQIFEESHYALNEIKLYIRLLDITQPQSILQWQLTSDYSPLVGGGVFGNDSIPLQPTQRFWNLKQLSGTPAGLNILPVYSENDHLYVSALGSKETGRYVIHIVNEGPEREVVLKGLPTTIKKLSLTTTSKNKKMEKGKNIRVKNGATTFKIEAASFITLDGE